MTDKNKKILSYLIKAAIVLFAFWFIYHKLVANDNLRNFKILLTNIPQVEIIVVIGSVLLLMLVNWFLEAAKWKRLMTHIERISFYRAIE